MNPNFTQAAALALGAGLTFFYHANALLSPHALTDASGNVVERYTDDIYGQVAVLDPTYTPISLNAWGTAHSPVTNTWLFTGQPLDEEAGLYFYRARYYEAGYGRFLQRDPSGVWHDPLNHGNGYECVGDSPVNYTDWSGRQANGTTDCDPTTGKTSVNINNTRCSGVCTRQHEQKHADDLAPGCTKYGAEYKNAKTDKDKEALRTRWYDYIGSGRNWFECRGHTESVSCAEKELESKKCADCPREEPRDAKDEYKKKWKEQRECCDDLAAYKRNQEGLKKDYCDRGGARPNCPF